MKARINWLEGNKFVGESSSGHAVVMHAAVAPGSPTIAPSPMEYMLLGAGGCTACHSPGGDLRGIAHKYSAPDLQARMLYPVTKKKTEITVTLPSGEKVTGSLVYQSNFDIAIDDGGGWYHSWPRDSVKIDIKDPLQAHRELLLKYTDALMHDVFAYLETLE